MGAVSSGKQRNPKAQHEGGQGCEEEARQQNCIFGESIFSEELQHIFAGPGAK